MCECPCILVDSSRGGDGRCEWSAQRTGRGGVRRKRCLGIRDESLRDVVEDNRAWHCVKSKPAKRLPEEEVLPSNRREVYTLDR